MRFFRLAVIPLIILLVVKILFFIPSFSSVENKAQDSLFRFRGPIPFSDDIVIIGIDDNSFSAMDISWPFPREYHAKLIENLNIAGARQIIFDVEFTESSNKETDELLAQIAKHYGNVVFAGKVIKGEDGFHEQLLTPIKAITDLDIPWGIVNTSPDIDNVIRRYPLYESYDETPYYSLGMKALSLKDSLIYREYKEMVIEEKHRIPLVSYNRSLINYFGPGGTFPTFSYSDVIDDGTVVMPGYHGAEIEEFWNLAEAGVFADKIVLVGATADELHDNFPTPFGGQWTAGVEIHANFIAMAMSGNYIKQLPLWLYFIIELILVIAIWLLCQKTKPQYSAPIVFLLFIGQYFLAFILFKNLNILIPVVQTAALLLILYVSSLVSHYLATQKEKRFIRSAFQQYMAPQLVGELLKNPKNISYGGTLQKLSVLFSDVRGFTTYTETHAPEETVAILKEYLTAMVEVILENNGILDKFVGDAVMALFGTPVKLPNHAYSACKTALDMRDRLNELQDKWRAEGREIFEIGIGVNTGKAVVGNLGSEQIFDYTAIGDTINLGARLESINKDYDTQKHIIISEFTLEMLGDLAEVRYLDEVKVKGKNEAVKIYELLSLKELP